MAEPRDWRPIINAFNPSGALTENAARYYVDRSNAATWAGSLQQEITDTLSDMKDDPASYRGLLTGQTGSGKSTELLRVGQMLAHMYVVVQFDAEASLVIDEADRLDVLVGMTVAVNKIAMEAGYLSSPGRLRTFMEKLRKVAQDLGHLDSDPEVSIDTEQLSASVAAMMPGAAASIASGDVLPAIAAGGTALANSVKLRLKLGKDVADALELTQNKAAVIGALNELLAEVVGKAGKPILIIADGLDKVSAEQAKAIFSGSLLTEPACALLFTTPIEFYHQLQARVDASMFDPHLLPNLLVHQRPAEPTSANRDIDSRGVAVLRQILDARVQSHGAVRTDVIGEVALERLARESGGIVREFIRLFREAARIARGKNESIISDQTAERAVFRLRNDAALRVKAAHRDALRAVLERGAMSGADANAEQAENELLRSLALLIYRDEENGTSWLDAHPSVLPLLYPAVR